MKPHDTSYNVKRILKGYTKKVKCEECNTILYTKYGGGNYLCWHCIKKSSPDEYYEKFKQ